MTHGEFWAAIHRFAEVLQGKGITLPEGKIGFGFAFVHEPPNRVHLMLNGRPLGRVTWNGGSVDYDPSIGLQGPARMTEDEMTAWVSHAYAFGLG